ncbi:acetyl-CoA carboxylase biotin carboxylase subunit, partial [Acinetobacter baumannii]
SHIYPGYSIPPYYDSMIAKLIAHGKDRETSLARMRQALDEMILTGIKTNIPLHKDLILQDKNFCSQAMDIHYLEKHLLKQVEEEKKAETA